MLSRLPCEVPMYGCARLGFILLITLTTSARAQHTIAGPQPSRVLRAAGQGPLQHYVARDTVPRDIRPTHWKEGAIIGGLTTGLAFGLLADGFCQNSETGNCGRATVGGFLLGGALGGLIGALIGGQFTKGKEP